MGFDPNEPEQRRRLREAINAAGIPVSELWLRYFGIAGDAGEYEVEAYLQGLLSLPPLQRDLLAMAANELIEDTPRPHAPYGDEFDPRRQPGDGDSGEDSAGGSNVTARGVEPGGADADAGDDDGPRDSGDEN